LSDVILHLGGNWHRVEQTAVEAKRRPMAHIVISSEGGKPQLMGYLKEQGIDAWRVTLDDKAYDTVGNFTDTFPLVRRLGGTRVFVVTSDWHMKRAMAIAAAAYAFSGIQAVACPWADNPKRVDKGNLCWDVSRTVKWRLDGRPTSRDYRR
jgi:hypothetical protein